MSETDVSNTGRVEAGYTVKLRAYGTAMTEPVTGGAGGNTATLDPIIYHKSTDTFDVITDFTERTYPATQRRRSLVRGGDVLPI